MSIKNKISENIYEIYVEGYPDKISLKLYRGDYFSFTLIGFNYDDTPFDFSIYDSFKASIRIGDQTGSDDEEYEFTYDDTDNDNFVLGQSNNASGNIKDELHIISNDVFSSINSVNDKIVLGWFDVEGSINSEIKTFIKARIAIEIDITR